jgi:hypothetical protein
MPHRRIDCSMLSLTTSVAIASGATSLLTQNLLYLPQIAIPLLLWLQLRLKIPSNGLGTDTTEGNPHTLLLLVWLSLCLALAMIDRNKMKLIRSIGLGNLGDLVRVHPFLHRTSSCSCSVKRCSCSMVV